ncbi:MAG: NADH:flavin oxidoreductase/NADH oxidase family protein [Spirochaetes bacterium]|nr:NADH:flavin oxidoreductase/NADH oxidase family protein [Spirochaetota bacterium]
MAIEKNIQLPCGVTLKNRLAKSAMSENMAVRNLPDEKLVRLYETWGAGEIGLIVTGNVMVDNDELGEPNNVVLENDRHLDLFRRWTSAAKKHGSQIWAQINHPGRQAPAAISKVTVAPSPVKLKFGNLGFRVPRELSDTEIRGIIARFAHTARLCKEAGFDGVQIHGAHGYLVSQFLSPLANLRQDQWGGSIENRMRFVVEMVRAMRAAVGSRFPIGIKINSADFQRGGFNEEDAVIVVKALEAEGIDLIEISGGNYESAAMTGAHDAQRSASGTTPSLSQTGAQDALRSIARGQQAVQTSTAAREAYFLPFAEKIKKSLNIPLMLTGGFRSAAAMNQAIDSGAVDIVGIARPLAMEPQLGGRLIADKNARIDLKPVKTGISALDRMGVLEIGYYSLQLKRIGEGKEPDKNLSPLLALPLLGLNYSSGILSRFFNRDTNT